MAKLKVIELQSALTMKRASLTLYSAPEPEIPDQLEQARLVADYFQSIYEHIDDHPNVEKYQRLRSGELDAVFRQYTQAEIDKMKGHPTPHSQDILQNIIDEHEERVDKFMMMTLEEQLLFEFRDARANLWGVELGS